MTKNVKSIVNDLNEKLELDELRKNFKEDENLDHAILTINAYCSVEWSQEKVINRKIFYYFLTFGGTFIKVYKDGKKTKMSILSKFD